MPGQKLTPKIPDARARTSVPTFYIRESPLLGKNPKMTYWEPTLLKMAPLLSTPKQFESASPLLSESFNTTLESLTLSLLLISQDYFKDKPGHEP